MEVSDSEAGVKDYCFVKYKLKIGIIILCQ